MFRRQLDPNAKVFGALDLIAGYHQVAISEEDKDYTMFMLPWGHFRYEVLQMELRPSGDIFNIQSDRCVRKVEGCTEVCRRCGHPGKQLH